MLDGERQEPLMAKQPPFARLMPPVALKVEVAWVKFAMPARESKEPGVEVPRPRKPFAFNVNALALEVALYVEVAIYRLPPAERKAHWFAAPSERASCGAAEESTESFQL